VAHNI